MFYIIGKKWHNFQLINTGPSYVSNQIYKKCLEDVITSGIDMVTVGWILQMNAR